MTNKRIYLSPPHMCGREEDFVREASQSNWIAPLGPNVDGFEDDLASYLGCAGAAALSSGTAAIHLALQLLGVGPGDHVLVSDLTFAASANPVRYLGAEPIFVDADRATWNLDPMRLEEALEDLSARGVRPKALIVTHLYGVPADMDPILAITRRVGLPVVEDAAEALGTTYRGKHVGTFGRFGVLSFNGNKILSTSGGGALVSDDLGMLERARFLATQARDPAPHYEHSTLGYNYRLSNVLAGIGRGQMTVIEERVMARRANFAAYSEGLGELPGVSMMPSPDYGRANHWLTCLTIDPELAAAAGVTRDAVIDALNDRLNAEARPVWKPMHMQPLYHGTRCYGGDVGEALFRDGLCLPSGSSLEPADRARIIDVIRGLFS